ncbi:MAG TPA: hypothetical protein PK523_09245, partial [Elusimicrobiales bacterium]|nr:hypothetical protein [Elusimicrobiales bacterium]
VVPEAVLDVRGDILALSDGPLAYRFLNAAGTDGVVIDTSNGVFRTAAAASYSLGSLAQPWKQLVIGGGAVSSIDGSLGIGTSSPATRFQVENGSISITGSEPALLFGSGEARVISQDTDAATGAGIEFSTNVYIVGFSSAAKYYGDGSALTGVTAPGAVQKAGDTMSGSLIMSAGQFLAANGNVSAPAYSFAGDPDTGLFTQADTIQFAVSGAEKARFNINGFRLADGTAADPALADTSAGSHGLFFPAGGGLAFASGAFERMRVDASGYVGIGTGTPVNQLHVYSSGEAIFGQSVSASSTDAAVRGWTNGAAAAVKGVATGGGFAGRFEGPVYMTTQAIVDGTATVKGSAFSVGGSTLVVDSGLVGLGTEAPRSRLDVVSGSITTRGSNAGLVLETQARTVAPETDASLGAGIRFSTNVYIVGFSSAANYYGDGSGLTGVNASDDTKLPLTGGTMTGDLRLSASTMTLNAAGSFANLITAGLTGGATMIMYADLSSAGLFTVNATDRLKIGAGMTETLTVANGRVGINNQPSPVAALQVSGTTKLLADPATGYLLVAGSAARPDMFFISSGGVVGVGDFSSSPVSTDTLVNISPVLRPGDDIVVGLQVYARSDTGNAVVVAGEETGVVAANFEAEAGGDDTMENLAGLRAQIRREGAGGGAVQQAAAIWVDNFHHDGGGTTVNTYGLRISSLTVPGQTNAPYAIYSEDPGARTYFAGDLGISSVPAYALVVSSQTGDVLWVSSYAVHGMKFVGDGSGLTGVSAEDNTKLPLAGGSLSGQLTIDGATLDVATLTVKGDAFSVGISSSFAVKGGSVAIGIEPGWARLHLFGDNPDNGAFVMEQLGGGVAARILGSKTGTGNTAVSDGEAIFDIRYDG